MITAVEVSVSQPIQLTYTYEGPETEDFPDITPTPDYCTVGYNFEGPFIAGTDDVAPFAKIENGQLVIETLDTSLHGMTRLVDIQYTPKGSSHTVGTNIITYELTFDACALNSFTVDPPIDDFEYQLGSGPVTKDGSFVS